MKLPDWRQTELNKIGAKYSETNSKIQYTEKCGDTEITYPDKKLIEVLATVLEHNKDILDMNTKIINALIATPKIIIKEEE